MIKLSCREEHVFEAERPHLHPSSGEKRETGNLHADSSTCSTQTGSFVPADSAVLGIVDRVFARVGSSDNVSKHMSTFHLEMSETAHILCNSTQNSLVILDEIGPEKHADFHFYFACVQFFCRERD